MASAFALAAEAFDPTPNPHADDPAGWMDVRLGEKLWDKQDQAAHTLTTTSKVAVPSCHDAGKARPLTASVPTPTGWTTMGQLRPGDWVLDENGQPTLVVAKSSVWRLPCYRVTFDDGTTEVVNGQHEWTVLDLRHRRRGVTDWRDHWDDTVTLTTDDLLAEGLTFGGQRRWRVPLTRPLDLPDRSLPIAPYVLGAWLGDGTSIRPEITCHPDDREIVDRIATLGENVRRRDAAPYAWVLTGQLPDRPLLRHRLRDLDVLGNKHIPTSYLRASYGQRLELLRGIMDTDGFVARGSAGIDLCDDRLSSDVAELVRTLGWKVTIRKAPATCNGVEVGVRYRMQWRTDANPFHLTRKAEQWTPRAAQGSAHTVRTIVAIEPTETVDTVCIEVNSTRHLYLAGEAMVPTHNSFLASRLACWWLDTHPPGEAFVVSTAPTFHQVRGILWREIGKAAAKAHARGNPLPGRVLETEWKIGSELVGWGRKPADHDEHGFQGIHARYVLVLIDEACGVPPQLWDAVESITTTSDARILAIGNPTDPTAEFARKCKPGSGWATVHIDGLATPNMGLDTLEAAARQIEPPLTEGQTQALLDEARTAGTPDVAPGAPHGISDLLLQPSWVADKVRTWGIGSPMWQGKVRGLFPDSAEDALIPLAWIEAAQTRQLGPRPDAVRLLAVDVARYGDDETVIGLREDERLRLVHFGQRQSTTETAGKTAALHRQHHTDEIRVDGVGVGGGVVDNLADDGLPVIDMQAGMAAQDPREFGNARAEWYWHLRRRFDPADETFGSIDIDDELMAGQLQALKYRHNARGLIFIESKDDMKSRGMPSPDRADVAMMAFAEFPDFDGDIVDDSHEVTISEL